MRRKRFYLWLLTAFLIPTLAISTAQAEAQAPVQPLAARALDRAPRKTDRNRSGLLVAEVRDPVARQAVRPLVLGPIDLTGVRAEDGVRDFIPGVPTRIGINRPAPNGRITPESHGVWRRLADGTRVWSLPIESPAAEAIRVHFAKLALPEGARLAVMGAEDSVDVYTSLDFNPDSGLWTAATSGPVAFVEYQQPPHVDGTPTIVVDEISHLYRGVRPAPPAGQGDGVVAGLLSCHEDVTCWDVDSTARDAVGRMFYTVQGQGTFVCTGALLADADTNTFAGYFLTANHCISTESVADTLNVYWFYQSSVCNGPPPSLLTRPRSIGAQLLATSSISGSGSDSTLLRLDSDPRSGQGFASWSTSVPATGTQVRGIHHPGGSHKRYSEGPVTTQSPICGTLPTARYIYNDWTSGITEGGSSGSPLFNGNWEIVGQLYGVCYFETPGCNNPQSYNNVYGKFSFFHPQIAAFLNTITPDDVYEDNDSMEEAPFLAIGEHSLILVDLDDYFAVSVGAPGQIQATATFSHTVMNLDLELLDEGGVLLDESVSTTGTETVVQLVEPGTYYVHADRLNGHGAGYTLTISLTVEGCQPDAPGPETGGVLKNRYLTLAPGNDGEITALRVTFDSLYVPQPPNIPGQPGPDLSALVGQSMWVGPPQAFTNQNAPPESAYAAALQCTPHYQDWGAIPVVHVYGETILPSSTYSVQALYASCDPSNPTSYSPPLVVATSRFADVAPPYQNPSATFPDQPNVVDISSMIDTLKQLPSALPRSRSKLRPALMDPEESVTIIDVGMVVDAVKGFAYPLSADWSCP